MRIDAYNQIAQVYKTTSAAKLQKTENARHGRDEVQIFWQRLSDRKTGSH